MPVNWENYLPEVMMDVDGCPDSVAENAVKQSAIEFCRQSRVWREQLANLNTVDGTATYSMSGLGLLPADSNLIALHKVQHNDESYPLDTIAKIHLDTQRQQTTKARPKFFNGDTPDILRLYRTPDAVYEMLLWAILEPTKAATSGPDFLYDDWLEAIAHGAKARLKAMSGRSWVDKSMIKFHRREFITGWVDARIADAKSNVMSSSRAIPQNFGFYRPRRN